MPGAATRRLPFLPFFALTAAAFLSTASPGTAGMPRSVWGVSVAEQSADDVAWKRFPTLRRAGINAVVVDGKAFYTQRLTSLRTEADSQKLAVVVMAGSGCTSCPAVATSPAHAMKLARSGRTVVARLASPAQVRFLRGLRTGRVVALVELRTFSLRAWEVAIEAALADARLDLAVAPVGARSGAAFDAYTKVLRTRIARSATPKKPKTSPPPQSGDAPSPAPAPGPGGGGGGGGGGESGGTAGDSQAPSAPAALAVATRTDTSVTLTWTASTDNVGVTGYSVFRDGTGVGGSSAPTLTVTALTCGTSYSFGVEAYDAAGNRSSRAVLTASTAACPASGGGGGGGGGGGADTQAPTAPAALAAPTRTQTSVTLTWTASTDNVAVTGYSVFRNGTSAGTSTTNTRIVSGLTCSTSYTFGVEAYDAAGNRSTRTLLTASTTACPTGPTDTTAPSTPGSLRVTSSSDSSVAVSWSAASDNVGVSGYGVYRNGSSIGSTASTSYSFNGLSCNTSYTLGVDAYDAAGNRSGRATVTATTASCPLPGVADAYVSPTGSDSGLCTQAAPCRSLDRAYRVVAPGAVVEVAGGSYGNQDLNHDPNKPATSARVLFRPAAGATVTLNSLENWASNVHYKDFLMPTGQPAAGDTGVASARGGKNVTMENLTATKPYVWNTGTVSIENLLILGGNFGPHPSCGGGAQITDLPKNVTIDGATFHDFTVPSSCSSAHLDCVHTFGSDGLTIRNSRFVRCQHFGILVNGGRDITIENNFLDGGIYGFKLRGDTSPSVEVFTNVLIRFNSADEISLGTDGSNTLDNVRVENNAATNGVNCRNSGVTYTGNYSQNTGGCGTTDRRVVSLGFTNPGDSDFHLTAGSPLIDAATGSTYPSTDYDRQARPLGVRADVGADER